MVLKCEEVEIKMEYFLIALVFAFAVFVILEVRDVED